MAVLDASAIIAVLKCEPGAAIVLGAVREGAMSTVNLCEVLTKLAELGVPDEVASESVGLLSLEIVDFDRKQAVASAGLRLPTRHRGLSMGDRACLALAMSRRDRVLTTDRAWSGLDLGVEIEVIR